MEVGTWAQNVYKDYYCQTCVHAHRPQVPTPRHALTHPNFEVKNNLKFEQIPGLLQA